MADNHGAPLPFGIPQLDELFDSKDILSRNWDAKGEVKPEPGQPTKPRPAFFSEPTSLAIVGQDGTGKSVFAMHLASTYFAVCQEAKIALDRRPFIFYVSSDLRYETATNVWENFALDYPWQRFVPFVYENELWYRRHLTTRGPKTNAPKLALTLCAPGGSQNDINDIVNFVNQQQNKKAKDSASVGFIDLGKTSAGDDWLFVTRLVATLPKRAKDAPPNLLVIDSVAGFETLVGEHDGYGQASSRRARIAQILRAAGQNWHVIFVVEEPPVGTHHPEEYVTETVLHLRRYGQNEKVRRLLEIEKCRGRAYGAGEHPFEIRSGKGSSTGIWENPDDPYTTFHGRAGVAKERTHCAYIQVFPSLHYLSKEIAESRENRLNEYPNDDKLRAIEVAPFGIDGLDEMLAQSDPRDNWWRTPRGLPVPSVTALMGEEGTHKTLLAEQFLIHNYEKFPIVFEQILKFAKEWKDDQALGGGSFSKYLVEQGAILKNAPKPTLIHEQDTWELKSNIGNQLLDWSESFRVRADALNKIAKNSTLRLKGDIASGSKMQNGRGNDANALTLPLKGRWDEDDHYRTLESGEVDSLGEFEHTLICALTLLRMSGGFLPAVVFISTHDVSSQDISREIVTRCEGRLRGISASLNNFDSLAIPEAFWQKVVFAFRRLLERFIIVRRIELADATAPLLWHTVIRCVEHAAVSMGAPRDSTDGAKSPKDALHRIRVVISDLRTIRDTYPAVQDDSLFLPTVVFRLRRLGVASVIVDSDYGRPGLRSTDNKSGELRSLADHQIYTWKVRFFNEQRNAISVIPPFSHSEPGVIREVRARFDGGGMSMPVVDPHFERYKGVEEGRPEAVSLKVKLFADTPLFRQYVENEQRLFTEIFAAQTEGIELTPQLECADDYSTWKDYCKLAISTKLPYTLVFMVEGYWGVGAAEASLRSQREYLLRPMEIKNEYGDIGKADFEAEHPDAFQLFRGVARDTGGKTYRRISGFQQLDKDGKVKFYRHRIGLDDATVDRVPFTWDFGLLVCDKNAWEKVFDTRLPQRNRTWIQKDPVLVRDVWEQLIRVKEEHADLGKEVKQEAPKACVSWVDFFSACVAVSNSKSSARQQAPFEVGGDSKDTLLCLMLEIWFSELLADCKKVNESIAVVERFKSDPRYAIFDQEQNEQIKTFLRGAKRWFERTSKVLGKFSRELQKFEGKRDLIGFRAMLLGETPLLVSTKPLCKKLTKLLKELTDVDKIEEIEGIIHDLKNEMVMRGCVRYMRYARKTCSAHPWVSHDLTTEEKKSLTKAWQTLWLRSHLLGGAFQLYETWMLLLEAIDFDAYLDVKKVSEWQQTGGSKPGGVAARHSFRTASAVVTEALVQQQTRENENMQITPARLPGHFSVKSDWFLAVAKGSRSSRLADRAIDLLSSRRANRDRLRAGVGLPTRDISPGPSLDRMRTALTVWSRHGVRHVTYGEVARIGGEYMETKDALDMPRPLKPPSDNDFYWLFRTGFKDFDHQYIALQSWIQRTMRWTSRYLKKKDKEDVAGVSNWYRDGSFAVYDALSNGELNEKIDWEHFIEFAARLDLFCLDLKNSS
jgi:KaiC/GvpD/RAD55 family RecA-like ATPase